MVTRRLFGFGAQAKRKMVRAEGLEPSRALRPNGFSYHFGFHRRHPAFVVWTIPSPFQALPV
jgi:hypothetical protein